MSGNRCAGMADCRTTCVCVMCVFVLVEKRNGRRQIRPAFRRDYFFSGVLMCYLYTGEPSGSAKLWVISLAFCFSALSPSLSPSAHVRVCWGFPKRRLPVE